jgi:hypothetical protein
LLPNCSGGIANPFDCAHQLIFGHAKMPRPRWPAFEHPFGFDLDQPTGQLCDAFESSPPDHFSAYKERHANSAPKIRLATMASHKARDGRLSPRAKVMWLVIMMQPVSATQSQSQNIPAAS